MTTETLSDKINIHKKANSDRLDVEDVREAIKKLKEKMLSEFCRIWESQTELNVNIGLKKIDEIFGEKLTK